MRILFLHQNAPGQFGHLATHLAADPVHQVVLLGQSVPGHLPGVRWLRYGPHRRPSAQTHGYLRNSEDAVLRGQGAARACRVLARRGFTPDLVVAHPGWGESLFLREVFPKLRIVSYCEMYYRAEGADIGYIPETELDLDGRCRLRMWNATLLLALEDMDVGLSPTQWQRRLHPPPYQPRIEMVHEGVDTNEVAPDPMARFVLPDGRVLASGDEVVTFVARSLEPYRGFVALMRALPLLLRLRPRAHVVVCGRDGVSYGSPPPEGGTWREYLTAEAAPDPARVHFVGTLPRGQYLALLRVSTLHLYLSIPYVLSWSCIEALASGCVVLGADTEPVREVLLDGDNGFLVDGRAPDAIAVRAAALLAQRAALPSVSARARATAIERFALPLCLAVQTRLLMAHA